MPIRWIVLSLTSAAASLTLMTLAGAGDDARAAVPAPGGTVLFAKHTGGYDCFRIPAVVRTRSGDLLAFAEGRRGGRSFCADAGDIDIVSRRSTDGGATWGPLQVVLDGGGDVRGNPSPVVDARTGRLVLLTTWECVRSSACGRRPHVQHSDDNGLRWSAPRELTRELGFLRAPDWFATGPGHGIQLERGRHAGRLVAGVNFSLAGQDAGALVYSDDAGVTWRLGATDVRGDASMSPGEISVVELSHGRLYAAARNQRGDLCRSGGRTDRAYAISADGGRSFVRPFAVEPELIAPRVQGATLRLRGVERGDRYNRILFTSPSTCDRRRLLTVRSSFDDGRHWQPGGAVIWEQDAAYSDMVDLPGYSVGILYESGPAFDANATIRWSTLPESSLGLPDGDTTGLPVSRDSSRTGAHAYLHGGPVSARGKRSAAVALDGSDDFVQVPFAEALASGSRNFTWTGWFKYGSLSTPQALLWAYGQGPNRPQVWLRAEPGGRRIRAHVESAHGAVVLDSRSALADNRWHHFALVRAGRRVRLYLGGRRAAAASGLRGSVSRSRPFAIHIGQRLDGQHRLRGAVDDYRLYGRALKAREIRSLAGGRPVARRRLRLNLRFSGAR